MKKSIRITRKFFKTITIKSKRKYEGEFISYYKRKYYSEKLLQLQGDAKKHGKL